MNCNLSQPLVSVICLTYNHEKYIRHCLEGFLMQKTGFDYEVIIHDDASTDATPDILREYAEKAPDIFKPILQKENRFSRGLSIIEPVILPVLRGKYIAMCEGDDYWTDPLKLEKQVRGLTDHPDCRLCLHLVENVTEQEEPMKATCPMEHIQTSVMSSHAFIGKSGDFFHLSSTMYYKADLQKYYETDPEYKRISKVGDKPLLLFLGTCGNVYFINEAMSCYRQSSAGGWTSRLVAQGERKIYEHLCNLRDVYLSFSESTGNTYQAELNPIILQAEYRAAIYAYPFRSVFQKKFKKYRQRETAKTRVRLLLRAMWPSLFPKLDSARKKLMSR